MEYMIGVDVGGTFTDITLVNTKTNEIKIHKVRSSSRDPSEAIVTGLEEIFTENEISPERVDYLAHGTTIATNALIERKVARTGLLITEGFKDLIEIGDQTRPSLYDLKKKKPVQVVPVQLRAEIPERILASGSVRAPLNKNTLVEKINNLKTQEVEAIAVCFLFSSKIGSCFSTGHRTKFSDSKWE